MNMPGAPHASPVVLKPWASELLEGPLGTVGRAPGCGWAGGEEGLRSAIVRGWGPGRAYCSHTRHQVGSVFGLHASLGAQAPFKSASSKLINACRHQFDLSSIFVFYSHNLSKRKKKKMGKKSVGTYPSSGLDLLCPDAAPCDVSPCSARAEGGEGKGILVVLVSSGGLV